MTILHMARKTVSHIGSKDRRNIRQNAWKTAGLAVDSSMRPSADICSGYLVVCYSSAEVGNTIRAMAIQCLVTSPGTWLMSQNDVYLSICLFGQIQKTVTTASMFPLLFYDRLKFEKVFYTAYEPALVSDALEEILIHVDLMQMSDDGGDGRLLAWYNSTALQFLYPIPAYFSWYGLHNREVLMERSVLFPGISPKLEFSTRTVIQETLNLERDPWQRGFLPSRSSRHSKEKKSVAVRATNESRKISFGAVHRSRSMPPRMRDRIKEISLEDDVVATRKPPFVVRKVADDLIGREPSGDHLIPSSHASITKKSVSAGVLQCSCHVQSCTICQAFQHYLGKPYHRHSCVRLRHFLGCSSHSGQQDLSSCQNSSHRRQQQH